MTRMFDAVTALFVPDLDADFVPHVGKRIAVVFDDSTPQTTMLAMCLRDWVDGGWHLTFATQIVVPRFPPPARIVVLDKRWERIGAAPYN